MKRILSPSTNATGLTSAIAALYAAAQAIWNAVHHHAAIDPQVIVAALAAAAALYTRFSVTPVKDPRNGAGEPLKTSNQLAADRLAEVFAKGARHVVLPDPSASRNVPDPSPGPPPSPGPDVETTP
jgi:CTP:molybdopterin cytidylyltransferase MocA